MRHYIYISTTLLLLLLLSACRNDAEVFEPESEQAGSPEKMANIVGLYLLNQGNMGSNKATLDYYDYTTATYKRNIYGEANPSVTKELGDVGNDLKTYGNRLYTVINCSNKVEVMDRQTARRIGQIDIPNCRYIQFAEGYAYVTSYAGPVQIDTKYKQLGYVAKVDTATMKVVATCLVGYQPDGIAIANGKIYVANSGGYMNPNYEKTLSVINLSTFTEEKRIEVAINLNLVKTDSHGQLWVSSRGDYANIPARLHCIDLATETVTHTLEVNAGNFDIVGDSLYFIGSQFNKTTNQSTTAYGIVNIAEHKVVSSNFITDGTEKNITLPYSIKVNPETHDILVTDAKNYVNPGTLYCFGKDGRQKWNVRTGDIPAEICFVTTNVTTDGGEDDDPSARSPYIAHVYEFMPAPGQFVNVMPQYEDGDDAEAMRKKTEECIAKHNQAMISLGGWGGYVVFGFDHRITNIQGDYDLKILGNAFYSTSEAPLYGSSEPGIVMVSIDSNGNGLPDDEWYELAGSEYHSNDTKHDYSCTYTRPATNTDVSWTDNMGGSGVIKHNTFHTQEYYPKWINDDEIVFSGTRLKDNGAQVGSNYVLYQYPWGYADNHPNNWDKSRFPDTTDGNLIHVSEFKIDWAVDSNGNSVTLPGIDFVKVYTAVNQDNATLGEVSTEIIDAWDLHMLDANGNKR